MVNRFFQFLGIVKKSGNLIIGYNKCEDAIKKAKVCLIVLSRECSDNTKNKFKNYCTRYNVPLIEGISSEGLSTVLGKEGLNVLGIANEKMTEKLISLHKEFNN
ncbi:ribosomal L7Ae/L30e/S12e/Gadd45 family protein [Haloimpatiens massiliensis]|uniref:ribosomal L7Ae/L30e/S12e/Gadd45 family protein n=1 Tax=Haloimpatiens massiliensis TaxID=1658110 RepID=UPI000C82D425|nr:ribosomal L7Ae/L30e/S12e/Gadd45 family protein [Haloimpatiens massiliensis]